VNSPEKDEKSSTSNKMKQVDKDKKDVIYLKHETVDTSKSWNHLKRCEELYTILEP
jgi:hypothetical protein